MFGKSKDKMEAVSMDKLRQLKEQRSGAAKLQERQKNEHLIAKTHKKDLRTLRHTKKRSQKNVQMTDEIKALVAGMVSQEDRSMADIVEDALLEYAAKHHPNPDKK